MTAAELINKALSKIGVIAAGQAPASEEADDALAILNGILQSWNAQQITLYSITTTSTPLTGAASYTLAARPRRIKAAEVRATNGATQVPALVDAAGWRAIPDKTRTGLFAEALYCDYGFPTATVRLSPNPATGTLELDTFTALTAFASLSTNVNLPDGYERALIYALAIDLAPEYGKPIDPAVSGIANESKNAITQLNALVLGEMAPGAAVSAQPGARPPAAA